MPNRIEIPSREFIKAVAKRSRLFMSSPDRIEAAETFFTHAYRAGAMNEAGVPHAPRVDQSSKAIEDTSQYVGCLVEPSSQPNSGQRCSSWRAVK